MRSAPPCSRPLGRYQIGLAVLYVGQNFEPVGNGADLASANFSSDFGGWSTSAFSDGVVYVESDDRNLYALAAATGELLWQYDSGRGISGGEALSGTWGDPRVAEGAVFVSSQNGRINALPTRP